MTYESGGEVYVQGYPTPGEPIPISGAGGTNPAWSRNGSELYYRRPAKENPQRWQMMVVDIDDRKGFRASEPRALFGPIILGLLDGFQLMARRHEYRANDHLHRVPGPARPRNTTIARLTRTMSSSDSFPT